LLGFNFFEIFEFYDFEKPSHPESSSHNPINISNNHRQTVSKQTKWFYLYFFEKKKGYAMSIFMSFLFVFEWKENLLLKK
jgi:hypothetical protein